MKSSKIFLKQSKHLHLFLRKIREEKLQSCQRLLHSNISPKDIRKNAYSGLASCWHIPQWGSLNTHWCLCPHGCHRPFHLCHSPGWTYALTFLPIIKKRETWLFNQTLSPTLIPRGVSVWWLGDSIPSRMSPNLEDNKLMSHIFFFFLKEEGAGIRKGRTRSE